MEKYILVINPGSTSTKVAIYNKDKELWTESIEHNIKQLDKFANISDQYEFRKKNIVDSIIKNNFDFKKLECVIGRGGVGIKPVKSGGYIVNDVMVNRLKNNPLIEHASNLGALIASDIADEIGCNAYIYDPVATDEFTDISRISGLPEVPRYSAFHALNSRAMAMKTAEEKKINYNESNFIVAHLGGGISMCVLEKGRAIDICADDEGPFSPERAGAVPCNKLVDICYNGGYEYKEMKKRLRGKGGIRAYLNTTDLKDVCSRVEQGDKEATLIIDAMIYQIAKAIGALATTLCGKIDYIIITGGVAYDKYIVNEVEKRVKFIAPVKILPGENEMMALANGAYRIIKGEESAQEYTD